MFWPEPVQYQVSYRAHKRQSAAPLALVGASVWVLLTGCSPDQVETYTIPKEEPQTPAPIESSRTAAAQPSGPPSLTWDLPEGWGELAANQFRLGNFRIRGEGDAAAEVSIIPLPGLAGSDLDNVNRWRGQVGLGPIDDAELGKLATTVQVGDGEGRLFELAGTPPGSGDTARMLAVIHRREGTAWFIKMLGDDGLVEQQKPALIALLDSLDFGGGEGAAPMAAPAPSNPSPSPTASSESPNSSDDSPSSGPTWVAPAGWKSVQPGRMQTARFAVGGEAGASADASVAVLGGDGGGLLANVNRWRRQLGLAPIDEGKLPNVARDLKEIGTSAQLVSIETDDGARKMLAAIVPDSSGTWFYKLVGDADVVSQNEAALIQLIKSAGHDR